MKHLKIVLLILLSFNAFSAVEVQPVTLKPFKTTLDLSQAKNEGWFFDNDRFDYHLIFKIEKEEQELFLRATKIGQIKKNGSLYDGEYIFDHRCRGDIKVIASQKRPELLVSFETEIRYNESNFKIECKRQIKENFVQLSFYAWDELAQ